ncbi:MAG: hypothetical protein V4482_03285 [Pseudomonadota bacterium]
MNFKKYAVAFALGFFALSTNGNAAECPVGKDNTGKRCQRAAQDLETLSETEQKNERNEKVIKYKELFYGDSPCVGIRGTNKVHARCDELEPKQCAAEPTSCRWSKSDEECVPINKAKINFACLDTPAPRGSAVSDVQSGDSGA